MQILLRRFDELDEDTSGKLTAEDVRLFYEKKALEDAGGDDDLEAALLPRCVPWYRLGTLPQVFVWPGGSVCVFRRKAVSR